ncbi:unnamed protein product [Symbiodinium natans]|uniref:Uncharacterized protein n=1 Tax=Symbiodinium natans TaxID=878477 RepID=A0A812GPB4_9DINO|nr:unnamed protein product [Symbiodinium natans]
MSAEPNTFQVQLLSVNSHATLRSESAAIARKLGLVEHDEGPAPPLQFCLGEETLQDTTETAGLKGKVINVVPNYELLRQKIQQIQRHAFKMIHELANGTMWAGQNVAATRLRAAKVIKRLAHVILRPRDSDLQELRQLRADVPDNGWADKEALQDVLQISDPMAHATSAPALEDAQLAARKILLCLRRLKRGYKDSHVTFVPKREVHFSDTWQRDLQTLITLVGQPPGTVAVRDRYGRVLADGEPEGHDCFPLCVLDVGADESISEVSESSDQDEVGDADAPPRKTGERQADQDGRAASESYATSCPTDPTRNSVLKAQAPPGAAPSTGLPAELALETEQEQNLEEFQVVRRQLLEVLASSAEPVCPSCHGEMRPPEESPESGRRFCDECGEVLGHELSGLWCRGCNVDFCNPQRFGSGPSPWGLREPHRVGNTCVAFQLKGS